MPFLLRVDVAFIYMLTEIVAQTRSVSAGTDISSSRRDDLDYHSLQKVGLHIFMLTLFFSN